MNKIREVIAYKHYFEEFLSKQPVKVQDKVFKIIEAIETLERVPSHYLKHLAGTDGLYEARVKLGSNIWRVFCFFDEGRLVILLNGFQKKTQKTPKSEIEKALRIMNEYYHNKTNKHGN
ncbi:MAG: type II toxin-antitoxin system RelE/ParE family toxin [Cyclobacteriaceae bacterium]